MKNIMSVDKCTVAYREQTKRWRQIKVRTLTPVGWKKTRVKPGPAHIAILTRVGGEVMGMTEGTHAKWSSVVEANTRNMWV